MNEISLGQILVSEFMDETSSGLALGSEQTIPPNPLDLHGYSGPSTSPGSMSVPVFADAVPIHVGDASGRLARSGHSSSMPLRPLVPESMNSPLIAPRPVLRPLRGGASDESARRSPQPEAAQPSSNTYSIEFNVDVELADAPAISEDALGLIAPPPTREPLPPSIAQPEAPPTRERLPTPPSVRALEIAPPVRAPETPPASPLWAMEPVAAPPRTVEPAGPASEAAAALLRDAVAEEARLMKLRRESTAAADEQLQQAREQGAAALAADQDASFAERARHDAEREQAILAEIAAREADRATESRQRAEAARAAAAAAETARLELEIRIGRAEQALELVRAVRRELEGEPGLIEPALASLVSTEAEGRAPAAPSRQTPAVDATPQVLIDAAQTGPVAALAASTPLPAPPAPSSLALTPPSPAPAPAGVAAVLAASPRDSGGHLAAPRTWTVPHPPATSMISRRPQQRRGWAGMALGLLIGLSVVFVGGLVRRATAPRAPTAVASDKGQAVTRTEASPPAAAPQVATALPAAPAAPAPTLGAPAPDAAAPAAPPPPRAGRRFDDAIPPLRPLEDETRPAKKPGRRRHRASRASR